ARRALQAERPLAVAAAEDVQGVDAPLVELEGRIARDVAILAARVLQHGLDRLERGEAFFLGRSSRGDGDAHGEAQNGGGRDARGDECARHAAPSVRNGRLRKRLPVALNSALAIAGASGGTPTSPMPPDFSLLGTMWT